MRQMTGDHEVGFASKADKTMKSKRWVIHNALRGIPMYGIDDVRKWSINEVAAYADVVVGNMSTQTPCYVSARFIDQVCILSFNFNCYFTDNL